MRGRPVPSHGNIEKVVGVLMKEGVEFIDHGGAPNPQARETALAGPLAGASKMPDEAGMAADEKPDVRELRPPRFGTTFEDPLELPRPSSSSTGCAESRSPGRGPLARPASRSTRNGR